VISAVASPLVSAVVVVGVVVLLVATFLAFRNLTRWLTQDDVVEIDAMTRDGRSTSRDDFFRPRGL
jgi:hypothetical protein